MATSTSHTAAVRQVLRRIYPHQVMGYAHRHLRDRLLGSVTLADAVGLLETVVYALVPREAQGVVHFLQGLNTELCQAGPVGEQPNHRHRAGRQPRPHAPAQRESAQA